MQNISRILYLLGIGLIMQFVISTSANAINSKVKLGCQKPELLVLDANPPKGTKSVRYFIDEMRVSELIDDYAQQTNTPPVWKTVLDPCWLTPGQHTLRIEAETGSGTIQLESRQITVAPYETNENSVSLTGAWKFAEENELGTGMLDKELPEAVSPDYDDSKWESVFVPNSLGYVNQKWNKWDGIIGIYRKSINMKAPRSHEQISITLESCYWSGRVFVNGKEVGQTVGGYLPTRFDITDYINKGNNSIAVIVDNRQKTMGLFKTLPIFYWNWGGLLQEVHIDRNPDITIIDMKASGSQSGKLQIWPIGVNKSAVEQKLDLTVKVYDPTGNMVKHQQFNSYNIPAHVDGEELSPVTVTVDNPQLWDLEKGRLYTVEMSGKWGKVSERTGFRDIAVKDGDMLLNDKIVENLMGFNRHADYPGLGRTQPDQLQYQELKELYDHGFRIFRPGHYPTTPTLLDAADELGILVIEEINVTGFHGPHINRPEVINIGKQQLTKMIHRDRSHPSVIAWSVGNENLTDTPQAVEYMKTITALGRELDSSRLLTHVTWKAEKDLTYDYVDIICQNFYGAWYSPKITDIVDVVDAIQKVANKPIIISEYGAEAVRNQDGMGRGSEFYQSYIIDSYNRLLAGHKHILSKMYWTSTEFWARPDWDGGNPVPITPYHCKALQSYYRDYNKLAWRTINSPVRLDINVDGMKKDAFGGTLNLSSDTTDVSIKIKITEVKGKPVSGVLSVIPCLGFESKRTDKKVLEGLAPGVSSQGTTRSKLPFELQPNETKEVTVVLNGALPEEIYSGYCTVKAVIDAETEAHPQILTIIRE